MGRAPYKFQRGSGLSLITMNILLKIVQPAHVDLNKVKAESYRCEKHNLEEWSLRGHQNTVLTSFSSKIVKAKRQAE